MVETIRSKMYGERTEAFVAFEEKWSEKINEALTDIFQLDVFYTAELLQDELQDVSL